MSAEQQVLLDSIQSYIQHQMKNGLTVDQVKLDSMNAQVRALRIKETKVADSVFLITGARQLEKSSLAGSSFTIPAGKQWQVEKIYVNNGGSYNVLVTSIKHDKIYKEGELLFVPTWTAEAELLNGDKTEMNYIFKINESPLK